MNVYEYCVQVLVGVRVAVVPMPVIPSWTEASAVGHLIHAEKVYDCPIVNPLRVLTAVR